MIEIPLDISEECYMALQIRAAETGYKTVEEMLIALSEKYKDDPGFAVFSKIASRLPKGEMEKIVLREYFGDDALPDSPNSDTPQK